jgi:hypothetical protein
MSSWRGNWVLKSSRHEELPPAVSSVRSDDGFVEFSDWLSDKPLITGGFRTGRHIGDPCKGYKSMVGSSNSTSVHQTDN